MSDMRMYLKDPEGEAHDERLWALSSLQKAALAGECRAHLTEAEAELSRREEAAARECEALCGRLQGFCTSRRALSAELLSPGGVFYRPPDAVGFLRLCRWLTATEEELAELRVAFFRLLATGEELTSLGAMLAADEAACAALDREAIDSLPAREEYEGVRRRLRALMARGRAWREVCLPFASETLGRYSAALAAAMGVEEDGSDCRLGDMLAASREVAIAAERLSAALAKA